MTDIKNYIIGDYVNNQSILSEIINRYEEYRMCEAEESLFDLENPTDFNLWGEIYGSKYAHKCKEFARFWLGGTNYYINVIDKNGSQVPVCSLESVDALIAFINSTIPFHGMFLDLFSEVKKDYPKDPLKLFTSVIADLNNTFHGLIDFDTMAKDMFEEYGDMCETNNKYYYVMVDLWKLNVKQSQYYDSAEDCKKAMVEQEYELCRNDDDIQMVYINNYNGDYSIKLERRNVHDKRNCISIQMCCVMDGEVYKDCFIRAIECLIGNRDFDRLYIDYDGLLHKWDEHCSNKDSEKANRFGLSTIGEKPSLSVYSPNKENPTDVWSIDLNKLSVVTLIEIYELAF